jgi:hypothetical protein
MPIEKIIQWLKIDKIIKSNIREKSLIITKWKASLYIFASSRYDKIANQRFENNKLQYMPNQFSYNWIIWIENNWFLNCGFCILLWWWKQAHPNIENFGK